MSNVKKKTGSPSVISNHWINFNHDLDWKSVKILDSEPTHIL